MTDEPQDSTPHGAVPAPRRRTPRTPSEAVNAKREIARLTHELWMKYPDERGFFLAEVTALAKTHGLNVRTTTALMTELTRRVQAESRLSPAEAARRARERRRRRGGRAMSAAIDSTERRR
jgi:hypothetical protein